ncbi:glucosamine-6-phosphate deaminase [Alicyclobacillus sp. SO9]|uniref:glucosamine-6-phosphate deaminase n=1 Tax=Alicyclobacillus sp. SO9 TaxID=2665646 RepID=UPI0018E85199|nr:glucosamine-6-phosphate deaminase [Alicyclobacillus sp. SO9]QQE80551.1 glucosamine-6-phosphate deaminase [Alicyclobacillus sp. SO9]
MEITLVSTYQKLSEVAADYVQETMKSRAHCVLGLATGETPVGLYAQLVRRYRRREISFKNTTTFNLDEYVGLRPADESSYHYYMHRHLFRHVDMDVNKIHIPLGAAADLEGECRRYEYAIEDSGGIDLQILGIGRNGHIGFNEPGSTCTGRTRVVQLEASTLEANAQYFPSVQDMPHEAISMGIGTVLEQSRHILLLASGAAKAAAVEKMLSADETTGKLPASCLQLHPNVTCVLDYDAAANLSDSVVRENRVLEGGV